MRPARHLDHLAALVQMVVDSVGIGYELLEPGTQLEPNMVVSIAHGFTRDLVHVTDDHPHVLTR